MKTKQKQTGQHFPKRGRRKGQRALAIDPTEPLGSKLLKTVVGPDWDQEELQLVRSALAAVSGYNKHVLIGWIRDIPSAPPPTQIELAHYGSLYKYALAKAPPLTQAELARQREQRELARLARYTMERVDDELLGKMRNAITYFDSEFFCRIAKAVKHCETLRKQPVVDPRRYCFLCFASQHLCPDGIAGNVAGVIHTNKTASDVKRHFREVLKRYEPSERELSRWQRDCGVKLAHEKPGRKTGSKNQHGGN